MKCRLLHDSWGDVGDDPHAFQAKGFKVDHKDCWRLVKNRHAWPEDEECRIAAGITPEQMKWSEAQIQQWAAPYARLERAQLGKLAGHPECDAKDPKKKQESMADAARS